MIEFILGDFWHFVGAVILIGAIGNGIRCIVHGYNPYKEDDND